MPWNNLGQGGTSLRVFYATTFSEKGILIDPCKTIIISRSSCVLQVFPNQLFQRKIDTNENLAAIASDCISVAHSKFRYESWERQSAACSPSDIPRLLEPCILAVMTQSFCFVRDERRCA